MTISETGCSSNQKIRIVALSKIYTPGMHQLNMYQALGIFRITKFADFDRPCEGVTNSTFT